MTDTSGRTSARQFAFYDRDSSCWRTWPAISLWGSETYSGAWPKRGMTRSGAAFELPMPALRIDGSGCSSLPTPRASDANGSGTHGDGGMDLRTAVQLLPTPTAQAAKTLDDFNLWVVAARLGVSTGPPSDDGNTPSDDPHQPPPTTGGGSLPGLSSG